MLDSFYAEALGCEPQDLNSGQVLVITNEGIAQVCIAAGSPLALLAVDTGRGAVFSARPDIAPLLHHLVGAAECPVLDGRLCSLVEDAIGSVVRGWWFRGKRLYCDAARFRDQTIGEVRTVTTTDEAAAALHRRWGGEVFGQIVDGRVVAWAAVKPFSHIEWDLRVDTLEEFRGRGYAKSVVSAAVKHILSRDRIAGWGCDRTNIASLRTAESVGFEVYGLDFGCVVEEGMQP